MNREQRRRAARRERSSHLVQEIASGYECPDCNVETRLVQDEPGVYVLAVFHDDTCPAFNAMTKGGRA